MVIFTATSGRVGLGVCVAFLNYKTFLNLFMSFFPSAFWSPAFPKALVTGIIIFIFFIQGTILIISEVLRRHALVCFHHYLETTLLDNLHVLV